MKAPKAATLVTGNGNIEANGVDGDLFAKTSFGSIDAKNIKAAKEALQLEAQLAELLDMVAVKKASQRLWVLVDGMDNLCTC